MTFKMIVVFFALVSGAKEPVAEAAVQNPFSSMEECKAASVEFIKQAIPQVKERTGLDIVDAKAACLQSSEEPKKDGSI